MKKQSSKNREAFNKTIEERIKRDKERFLLALKNSMGMVVHAADKAKINRNTHYLWMRDDPQYRDRVEEILERNLDMSESVLLEAVKKGELTAVFYYLNNKGKSRGYNIKDSNEDEHRKVEIVIKSPLRDNDNIK